MDTILIAGAGQAGFQVAQSLRQDGFAGAITMIGEEPGLPYQRPPLSKGYMKDGRAERLLFRNADFFATNRITLEAGRRIVAIDRAGRCVRLDDGRTQGYDHLVLAVGARNRKLPLAGSDADNVLDLRTLEDAERLKATAENIRHAIVIGGGFIGLETAAVLRAAGIGVTVLEASGRLMARAVSAPISEHFLKAHRAAGTDVRLASPARRIVTDAGGRAIGVEAADGTIIEGDLIIIAAGVVANSELASDAGLATDDGILVDAHLLTDDPAISAIGDCARFPFAEPGDAADAPTRLVRLESVQNAVDQAKAVARHIMGDREAYRRVPWFWSDQGPDKLQIAGLGDRADRHVARAGADGRLTVFSFAAGRLVAVETVNAPADHMQARRLLAQPGGATLADLERVDFSLATLAGGRPR